MFCWPPAVSEAEAPVVSHASHSTLASSVSESRELGLKEL